MVCRREALSIVLNKLPEKGRIPTAAQKQLKQLGASAEDAHSLVLAWATGDVPPIPPVGDADTYNEKLKAIKQKY